MRLNRHRVKNVSASDEPLPAINGEIMGEMEVARLGLKVIVVQGDSPAILRRAVGHLPGTALPGESGNVALAGHRDTFFRPLRNIRSGDAITFKTLDGEFRYQVESTECRAADRRRRLATVGRTHTHTHYLLPVLLRGGSAGPFHRPSAPG